MGMDWIERHVEDRLRTIQACRGGKEARSQAKSQAWRSRHDAERERAKERAELRNRKCGARTRKGTACIRKALSNGRCPNHGGCSTGPKTDAGRQRIAEAVRQRWAAWRAEKACPR